MPVDPTDAVKVAEAAKSTWQWLAGGLVSGAYAVWKYFNHRLEKLENAIVTSKQLQDHTDIEEKKFDALFRITNDTNSRVLDIARAVSRLEGMQEGERRFVEPDRRK